jgi:uncharacterized SAM-binding protein YcdF (DUF218 family)
MRRRWRSAIWLGLPTFLIFLFGSTPLAETIVGAAEGRWARATLMEVTKGDAVLVLGGGYYVSDRDPYGFALCDGGTRVLTALELLREKKASSLVLGGGLPVPGRPGVSVPSLLESWIVSWGMAGTAQVITNLGICMNTHDEAVQFLKLEKAYGWRKVLLVTSALHMPRSVALFKKLGIEVQPVACDFKVYGVPDAQLSFSPFPRQSRFQLLGLYLHEKIGWWVYRWRGWV